MIKCGDSTSDPDHGKDRSDSDAYQVMRKDKTNRDCQTDIKKVETIFGKSYAFVDEIGDCLNNSISGIGDDTHVQRHGGTDACQNDGNDQKEDPSGKTSGKRIRISCPKIRVIPENIFRNRVKIRLSGNCKMSIKRTSFRFI